jgi:drug/metabolite transporter (DMT)-like permease
MAWARDTGGGRTGGWLLDQPYLLLSLTSLFWAGNTVLGRFIVGHVPPITLAFIRWSGAFVLLLPFAARHLVRDWPVIRKHIGLMTLLALTGISAYNTMAYYGLQYTTAINGLLLQSVGPLCVALWTFALFGDRLTLRQAGGICVSLTGVIVIICHGSLAALIGINFNQGDLWFIVALLSTVITRRCCANGRRCIRCLFSQSSWAAVRSCCFRRSWWRLPPGTRRSSTARVS